jgi:hypothetical protein
MDLSFFQDRLERMRWQTERLGAPGKIGFGLIVFSIVFFVAAVLPRQAEVSELMEKAEAVQASLRSAPAQAQQAQVSGGKSRKIQGHQALQAFYDFFPNIDSTPAHIREVVQSAAQHNVEIGGTEYRMAREKDVKLARYEMMVPVRGRYPEVRGFIADALRAVPAMALVDVMIKREGVETELLEASLKFNLYLSEDRQ